MIALIALGQVLAAPIEPPPFVTLEMIERGITSMGDGWRLQAVVEKARSGGEVTIGVIGGSITEGASATSEDRRYGNQIAAWWQTAFPEASIRFVNAGIGATGSDIGCHRAADHLLSHDPDFVVIEYAVNDADTPFAAETLEGLVRQVLTHPSRPAVMLLFMMYAGGGNAQEWHSKIGTHYRLPMVSLRDAAWPEIEAGRIEWGDVEADEVHPNDAGHTLCALLVTEVVSRHMAGQLPPPLVSDVYQHTAMLTPDNAPNVAAEGFSEGEPARLGRTWWADEPGATLEVPFEGTSCAIAYYRIKGDQGRAEAWVDDREPVVLEGWFEADWGGYSAFALIGRDLGPGEHTLHVRLLPDRAEGSRGHRFEVHAVLVAGREAAQ